MRRASASSIHRVGAVRHIVLASRLDRNSIAGWEDSGGWAVGVVRRFTPGEIFLTIIAARNGFAGEPVPAASRARGCGGLRKPGPLAYMSPAERGCALGRGTGVLI